MEHGDIEAFEQGLLAASLKAVLIGECIAANALEQEELAASIEVTAMEALTDGMLWLRDLDPEIIETLAKTAALGIYYAKSIASYEADIAGLVKGQRLGMCRVDGGEIEVLHPGEFGGLEPAPFNLRSAKGNLWGLDLLGNTVGVEGNATLGAKRYAKTNIIDPGTSSLAVKFSLA